MVPDLFPGEDGSRGGDYILVRKWTRFSSALHFKDGDIVVTK